MTVMVIAPHPDDDILGVGGTIAKRAEYGDLIVSVVVTNGYVSSKYTKEYIDENRKQYLKAVEGLGVHAEFLEFPTMMLEMIPQSELNCAIKEQIDRWEPKELYIPHWGDIHAEHKAVCQASLVASRPPCKVKRIYAYEVPSETGWSEPNGATAFIPNTYVDVTCSMEKKLEAMIDFKQQLHKNPMPRSVHAIASLAGYRGSQIGVKYAEAFELIREVK